MFFVSALQVSCRAERASSQANLISLQTGLEAIYPALIAILTELQISAVCLHNSHQLNQVL